MRTIEQVQNEIENKKELIQDKQYEIDNFEIDTDEKEDQFDQLLDESNEGIFNMLPSDIMRKCDPIMYRQELLNYVDSLEVSEEQEVKEFEEELQELTDELEELEEELQELETEEEE